jgi:hypothetical protein
MVNTNFFEKPQEERSIRTRSRSCGDNVSRSSKNDIHDEIKSRLNSGNACYYYSVQNLLSSRLI